MILTPEEDVSDSKGDPPCGTPVPTAVLPKKTTVKPTLPKLAVASSIKARRSRFRNRRA
jgi:hypothetical protein